MMKKLLIANAAALALCGVATAGTNSGGAATFDPSFKAAPASVAPSAVTYTSLGTAAPPATLGGQTMLKVQNHVCTGVAPPIPSPTGGTIGVSPNDGERCIGASWATWSHGYTGYVYYSAGSTSQTITLPAGTTAFYFYVEPNPFSVQTCSATAGGASSGPVSIDGSGGAKGFGFSGGALASVTITCDVDFASGEYGIAKGPTFDVCDANGDGTPGKISDLIAFWQGCKAGTIPAATCDVSGDGAFNFKDLQAWLKKCRAS